jgi:DNA-binding ferritin-like protein (Dps family)
VYGETVVGGQLSTPSRDLAALLNYFARILRAVETGAVDQSDLREMLGHHISWWNESLVNLQSYAAHACLATLAELVE